MKISIIVLIIAVAAILVYQQLQPQPGDTREVRTESAIDEQTTAAGDEYSDELSSLVSSAPDNAKVFIIEPRNESVVTSPLTVKFGIEHMAVAPAGNNQPNSGHHHLLIDLAELPDMSKPLPASDKIIHFGKAQTETTIDLAPGQHTLQLLLGNYLHIPHANPVISEKITITVE